MPDEIPFVPPVPEGLREAAQKGTLIPFVGAGASRLAGCPSWPQLADGALEAFVESGKFSYGQLAQIQHLNARVKLSLALGLARQHKQPIDFNKLISPKDGYGNEAGRRLFGSLSTLGKTFVTTNYDPWLDTFVPDLPPSLGAGSVQDMASATVKRRTVYDKVTDFIPANLNEPDAVFHLHGSLRNTDEMIVTTRDYILRYANDRHASDPSKENRTLTFLEYLFEKKTVLFIGYGLEELEILEYIIQKARRAGPENEAEARHFMLQGFYSHEFELMRSLSSYYREECGIQLIPFCRDRKDYRQLLDVLDKFAEIAPASEPLHLQKLMEMEGLLDD
jgi:SIR2-like domain